MASRACSSWLEDNIVVSSIQLGRRALRLYCHNCASVYEWRVVAARAPHHRIRAMPAEPKQRKCQVARWRVGAQLSVYQVTGKIAFVTEDEPVWRKSCRSMNCCIICQHHKWEKVIPVIVFLGDEHGQHGQQCPVESFHKTITARMVWRRFGLNCAE